MHKKNLFTLLLSFGFLSFSAYLVGEELAGEEEVTITDPCFSVVTPTALEGVTEMSAHSYVFEVPQKMENSALQELRKFGKVVFNAASPQSTEKPTSFLTYEVKKIRDIKGKKLPILQAMLSLKELATVENNQQPCYSTVWLSESYMQPDASEAIMSKTFAALCEEFMYVHAQENQTHVAQPTFYLDHGQRKPNTNAPSALEGLSSISVFGFLWGASDSSKKHTDHILQELTKHGTVLSSRNGEDPEPSSFLIYEIKKIGVFKKEKPSILQATLSFKPRTTKEGQLVHARSSIWSHSCYIETKDEEKAVSQTFSLLLKEFLHDLLEANTQKGFKPEFYFSRQ